MEIIHDELRDRLGENLSFDVLLKDHTTIGTGGIADYFYRANKVEELINIPAEIVEGAGQCGYIPLLLAAFAVSGLKVSSEVFSYEKPFGVGYLVGKGDIEYE